MNSTSNITELLKQQKSLLARTNGAMYPYIFKERYSKKRTNTKLTKAISHKFSVVGVNKFSELITRDILEEDRVIFKRLSLDTNSCKIPRLEKYISRPFCYIELVNTLLFLHSDKKLDLDNCSVYLNAKNYNLLIDSMKDKPVYKDYVLHIHGIPILTDKNHDVSCLSDFIYILNGKMQSVVYEDTVDTVYQNNELTIDSSRIVVHEFKPYKFFTIKV